jgi:hypothetical protein
MRHTISDPAQPILIINDAASARLSLQAARAPGAAVPVSVRTLRLSVAVRA